MALFENFFGKKKSAEAGAVKREEAIVPDVVKNDPTFFGETTTGDEPVKSLPEAFFDYANKEAAKRMLANADAAEIKALPGKLLQYFRKRTSPTEKEIAERAPQYKVTPGLFLEELVARMEANGTALGSDPTQRIGDIEVGKIPMNMVDAIDYANALGLDEKAKEYLKNAALASVHVDRAKEGDENALSAFGEAQAIVQRLKKQVGDAWINKDGRPSSEALTAGGHQPSSGSVNITRTIVSDELKRARKEIGDFIKAKRKRVGFSWDRVAAALNKEGMIIDGSEVNKDHLMSLELGNMSLTAAGIGQIERAFPLLANERINLTSLWQEEQRIIEREAKLAAIADEPVRSTAPESLTEDGARALVQKLKQAVGEEWQGNDGRPPEAASISEELKQARREVGRLIDSYRQNTLATTPEMTIRKQRRERTDLDYLSMRELAERLNDAGFTIDGRSVTRDHVESIVLGKIPVTADSLGKFKHALNLSNDHTASLEGLMDKAEQIAGNTMFQGLKTQAEEMRRSTQDGSKGGSRGA